MVDKIKSNIDISIIITAHSEGVVSHKTVLSVLRAADELTKNNISYEIIVSLDNPSEETNKYYSRYNDDDRFVITEAKFGNVAESRNKAIKMAKGKYVALLDGDDMISRNWYLDAYRMAEAMDGLFILHPNVQLQFGPASPVNLLWVMGDSYDKEKDARIMVQYNRWVVVLFAPKKVFNKVQYKKPIKGYGYEDFCFNADTLAVDIKHCIVPETVFFYRRLATGKQFEHINECTLLPYTDLFDIEYAKTWGTLDNACKSKRSARTMAISVARRAYGAAKRSSALRKLFAGKVNFIGNYSYNKKINSLPTWLIDEWKAINEIDNELWPTKAAVRTLDYHPRSFDQDGPLAVRAGGAYARLCRQFTKKPDYMFFTYDPLGAGGTEKVLFNYIRSLSKVHPDWHFAIMRKKPDEFPFEVPDNVDFIDFFGETEGLPIWEKDIVFDRLMVQTKVKRLHCFFNGYANGDYVYNWVMRHRKFLKENNYKLYISWFMKEFVQPEEKDRIMTFADPYLGEIYDCVTRVFTDNQTVVDETLVNNAYDPEKFIVHHQPMKADDIKDPREINAKKPLRILWASRLSFQKRPDIVKAIAEKLPQSVGVIDVYGREQNYDGNYLSGVDSLQYKGHFNGFKSLPLDKYDVFLYTSQVDGMPNVLLEATEAGLPIVASNDGGVNELVKNGKTGYLVELEDIDGYIEALRKIKKNPDETRKYVRNAQSVLKKNYSFKAFDEAVKNDIQ